MRNAIKINKIKRVGGREKLMTCSQVFSSYIISHTYLSDATINILGFTARYLPLPHPISKPTDPGSNFPRNLSTMGHGCKIPMFSENCVHGVGVFFS
jgi:hypothetical protein